MIWRKSSRGRYRRGGGGGSLADGLVADRALLVDDGGVGGLVPGVVHVEETPARAEEASHARGDDVVVVWELLQRGGEAVVVGVFDVEWAEVSRVVVVEVVVEVIGIVGVVIVNVDV